MGYGGGGQKAHVRSVRIVNALRAQRNEYFLNALVDQPLRRVLRRFPAGQGLCLVQVGLKGGQARKNGQHARRFLTADRVAKQGNGDVLRQKNKRFLRQVRIQHAGSGGAYKGENGRERPGSHRIQQRHVVDGGGHVPVLVMNGQINRGRAVRIKRAADVKPVRFAGVFQRAPRFVAAKRRHKQNVRPKALRLRGDVAPDAARPEYHAADHRIPRGERALRGSQYVHVDAADHGQTKGAHNKRVQSPKEKNLYSFSTASSYR